MQLTSNACNKEKLQHVMSPCTLLHRHLIMCCSLWAVCSIVLTGQVQNGASLLTGSQAEVQAFVPAASSKQRLSSAMDVCTGHRLWVTGHGSQVCTGHKPLLRNHLSTAYICCNRLQKSCFDARLIQVQASAESRNCDCCMGEWIPR